jgi:UbiD family decarboxylase
MAQMFMDLQSFLDALRREGDLVQVEAPVDPYLEAAEIHRRVIAAGGPALHFTRVGDSPFTAVTNLFGSRKRVEMAFGSRPREVVSGIADLPDTLMPPSLGKVRENWGVLKSLASVGVKRSGGAPVLEVRKSPFDYRTLPVLTTWKKDGGPFLTWPLVYTEHPDGLGHNLGIYRGHIHDATRSGMHWQIGKGGGFHYGAAEAKNQALPVNIYLGGPPALILSAAAPLPENVPELLLASLILGKKLPMTGNPDGPLPLVSNVEFALVGEVPGYERAPEGPFGDHYGYYSLQHDYPVFHCRTVFHRRDPIFPATVVGKPRQEDFYLGDFLQELLSPVFPRVMPTVQDLWSYGETGYHSLASAVVKQRYKREAMASAFRILGEGQLSLTKFLLVLDHAMDLRDFPAVLEHVLERADLRTDLYVFGNLSMDTLDYTGPKVNEGSKGLILGLGDPIRRLPREWSGDPPAGFDHIRVFCRGCLVVSGPSFADEPQAPVRLAKHSAFADWPLVVLVDDAEKAAKSSINFLWTTFTRFEPAADIHAAEIAMVRRHVSYTPPVVIDARLKPDFPEELFCDPETADKVTARWKEYFPDGMEMGDSDRGHLD